MYFWSVPSNVASFENCECNVISLCVTSQVEEELLVEALTKRKTVTVNDKLILPYSHSEVGNHRPIFRAYHYLAGFIPRDNCVMCWSSPFLCVCLLPFTRLILSQAITARDSMAKSLYSALFDWIVLRINHALLNKKDMEESVPVRERQHTHTCMHIGMQLRVSPLQCFVRDRHVGNS